MSVERKCFVLFCEFEMVNIVNGPRIRIYSLHVSICSQNLNIDGLGRDCININIDIYLDKYSKRPVCAEDDHTYVTKTKRR